jgi:hypothetical protein
LLPALRLPPLGGKSENIQGHKYHFKGRDGQNSALGSKICARNACIFGGAGIRLPSPASDLKKSRREKNWNNFMVQWQCLMSSDQLIWPSNHLFLEVSGESLLFFLSLILFLSQHPAH